MRTQLLLVLLTFVVVGAFAQRYEKELKVGDTLPVAELRNMLNYPKETLRFSDHKPKLTILDFWGTTCTTCVEAWPKLLGLQKEFGADLQIIPIDLHEDKKVVSDFIKRRKKLTGVDMTLPVSCKDSAWWEYCPRRSVPRYWWIDSNGVLASETHGMSVSEENIRRWITSGPFDMEQIINEMLRVKPEKPIFVDGNGGEKRGDAFIWSSSLTKGVKNVVGGGEYVTSPKRGYGICYTGATLWNLYSSAYNDGLMRNGIFKPLPSSRRVVIAKDSNQYYRDYVTGRISAPLYNYQLISGSPKTRPELQSMMRADLDRYFGLSATWEKRRRKCLVITMFDSTKAQQPSAGYYNAVTDSGAWIDGATVTEVIFFMEMMSFFNDTRPIVDETGFKGRLTGISIEGNCLDLKIFDRGLAKYGMHIKEDIRSVDVLVLRNPNED